MSLKAYLLVQLGNALQNMCPSKTSTLVSGFHSLLPAPKTATWKEVKTRQKTLPLHLRCRQPFQSAADRSKTLNLFSCISFNAFPISQSQRCFEWKTSNFGQFWGHHIQYWEWNKQNTRLPKIGVEMKMGKGNKKTKESSLYTFLKGIIQQYSFW